jgi:hypothetical protein
MEVTYGKKNNLGILFSRQELRNENRTVVLIHSLYNPPKEKEA